MIKTKEQIKEQVKDILDDNYCKFQGGGEADKHSCYEIAELFEQQTKELQDLLKSSKQDVEELKAQKHKLNHSLDWYIENCEQNIIVFKSKKIETSAMYSDAMKIAYNNVKLLINESL